MQSIPREELETSPNIEPWQIHSDSYLDRASHDSIPLRSRDPDGASSEECPAVSEENHVEEKDDDLSLGEEADLKNVRGNKKKRQRSLLACLTPARLSFRRKSERANQSKTDTTKLVKEI